MLRIDCGYGPSGHGKSTALARLVERYAEQNLKTRLYIGDGGLDTYTARGLGEPGGPLEVCEYAHRDLPFSVCKHMAQGFWPKEVDDPVEKWLPPTAENLKGVGLFIFEGLAVMGQYLMSPNPGGLADRAGKGESMGPDPSMRFKDKQTNWEFGVATGWGPYNITQRYLLYFLQLSKGLPGHVWWTTHERQTEDKTEGKKVIGPESSGTAMTANLSRIFSNTLHFTTAVVSSKQKDPVTGKEVAHQKTKFRIYTRDHYDPDAANYVVCRAVNRCAVPSMMPEYLEDQDEDNPGGHLLRFYDLMAEAREKSLARTRAKATSLADVSKAAA